MPGYYHLKKNAGNYHFNLKADNHEIILTSESYTTKQAAQNGIASCQRNSPSDDRYVRLTSKADQPYFVLKAGNGEIIGNSQMYASSAGRSNRIAFCKTNGPTSKIVDEA